MNLKVKGNRKIMTGLMVFLFFTGSLYMYGQIKQIRFNHLSIEDGLSQSTVNSIIQDKKEFMWFGTLGGLNQYDGYGFVVYNDPRETNGKVVKYMGDGVLGVFEKIINAIKVAIVFRDSLVVRESEIKLPMKTRITLTHGEVEELELDGMYDIGGQEVDKVARLQKEASPGQILADYHVIRNAELSLEANPFIKVLEITNKTGRKLKGLD